MNQNDLDSLMKALSGDGGKNAERIGKSAAASLNAEQRKKIEDALADPEYLKSLLSTPRAQEILKKLNKGDK